MNLERPNLYLDCQAVARLMTYVIAEGCCNDASCVSVCPVDCIRPRPGDPDFMSAEQLYIDPESCINCAACVFECPVSAIHDEYDLPLELDVFREINADYFEAFPLQEEKATDAPPRRLPDRQPALRVAVIGAGPSGCYAVEELSNVAGVEVSLFDRLPTPYGLVRAGVAPDHQKTKGVTDLFAKVLARPNVSCFFNVRLGSDVSVDDLLERHHAVIFTAGADADRKPGIAGENLPGAHSAREFVSWYNGHPEHADHQFDLSTGRVVIIGNGNVALDVARVIAAPAENYDATDLASHALSALRTSKVREVVVAARRGVVDAAYTTSEMLSLARLEHVDVTAQAAEVDAGADDLDTDAKFGAVRKLQLAQEAASRVPDGTNRTVSFRYGLTPVRIDGDESVSSITFRATGGTDDALETIDTGLVLFATGYRGSALPGVPFDDASGTIPNTLGRVLDSPRGQVVRGMYCAGWAKRGATGVIGTNRVCSAETVDQLFRDFDEGRLVDPPKLAEDVEPFVTGRQPSVVRFDAWKRIDAAELLRGTTADLIKSREKFISIEDMIFAAHD